MKIQSGWLLPLCLLAMVGCGQKSDSTEARSQQDTQSLPSADSNANGTVATNSGQTTTPPDNTGVNERDRNDANLTAGDQAENPADRKLAQDIRKAIVDDKTLSVYAHNVKIIAKDGKVTLRGPVRSEQERTTIVGKAEQIAGQNMVDNQLEVAG